MASNKRETIGEQLAPAEADLWWYFGDGASSAIGDVGLRSSLGSQLQRLAAGSKPKRKRKDADGNEVVDESVEVAQGAGGAVSQPGFVDLESIERRMAEGVGAVARVEQIETALRAITPTYRAVLRLAFGDCKRGRQREMRPGISHVVVLTAEARKAVAQEIGRHPSEQDVAKFVEVVDIRAPWLQRAQVAAVLLRDAAVTAFAAERMLVAQAPRDGGKRQLSPAFWTWKDYQPR